MSHRRKPKSLSEPERANILAAATAFHNALRRPLIDVKCADYVAKQKAHDAVIQLFIDLTGKLPPWSYETSEPRFRAPSQE